MQRRLISSSASGAFGSRSLFNRSYASWIRHRPDQAFHATRRGYFPQFVDVREEDEHFKERLTGTLNVPLTKLKAETKDADTADKLAYLDRSRPVYVHCDGGERAEEGATLFCNLGFTDVKLLEGGVFEISRDSGLIIERE